MLTRLEKLYIFYIKEHVILIFPLICNCIYLITLFYPLLYTNVKSGDLKIPQLIENLHNEFLRRITNLKKSTHIYMLHAELGRRPVEINIKSRMIGFWLSLVNGKETKLSKVLYNKKRCDTYNQISIFPHQNPPFLGPAGKSIKLIVIGICLDNTAAAQRNISGCRYNCEVCEMKLTWKTYCTVLFYPFYDIYSLAYSSIANMKKS